MDDENKFVFSSSDRFISEDLQDLQKSAVEVVPNIENSKGKWYLYKDDDFKKFMEPLMEGIMNLSKRLQEYINEYASPKPVFDFNDVSEVSKHYVKLSSVEVPFQKIYKEEHNEFWWASSGMENNFYGFEVYNSDAFLRIWMELPEDPWTEYVYDLTFQRNIKDLKILFIPYLVHKIEYYRQAFVILTDVNANVVGYGSISTFISRD